MEEIIEICKYLSKLTHINKAYFLNLLKQNVLINPGYIYESNNLHHIRLSYAYASFEELTTGLSILRKQST